MFYRINISVIVNPMPEPPPVISATLPLNIVTHDTNKSVGKAGSNPVKYV